MELVFGMLVGILIFIGGMIVGVTYDNKIKGLTMKPIDREVFDNNYLHSSKKMFTNRKFREEE